MCSPASLIGRLSLNHMRINRVPTSVNTLLQGPNMYSIASTNSQKFNQIRHSSHLNDSDDMPVIKLPVYYKEGMRKIKGAIRSEEMEEMLKRQRQGNKNVPIIRCRARKLAHHDGQTYNPVRVPLATYRWSQTKSAGQDFTIRPYGKNQNHKSPSDENRVTFLSGHVEQRFIRVTRKEKPNLLLKRLRQLNNLKDDHDKTPLIAVYCRKLTTASYLEFWLKEQGFFTKIVKGSMNPQASQLFMKELVLMNCNIFIKLDSHHERPLDQDIVYESETDYDRLEVFHLINYDCPDTIRLYEERFEDVIQGDVISGRRRTVTTFVAYKIEAELAQKIEKIVRLNT